MDDGETKPADPLLPEHIQRLMRYSGIVKGMPPDMSQNLDHYLYGHPKK